MGQFSWYAQDTGHQIFNDWEEHGDRQTIHMVDPRNGNYYKEEGYEGYGVFGGRDFYELLADINKDLVKQYLPQYVSKVDNYDTVMAKDYQQLTKEESNQKRLLGIDLWFAFVEPDFIHKLAKNPFPEGIQIVSPILVEQLSRWKEFMWDHPESDPDQGWHCIYDEDDEESYD